MDTLNCEKEFKQFELSLERIKSNIFFLNDITVNSFYIKGI